MAKWLRASGAGRVRRALWGHGADGCGELLLPAWVESGMTAVRVDRTGSGGTHRWLAVDLAAQRARTYVPGGRDVTTGPDTRPGRNVDMHAWWPA